MSCTVALHSNLGLGLFNLAPTSISILCRPSPILAFQHTLSILASCIYPSSCGPSTGLVPSVYPFSSFFGALSSFILNMWSTHWSLLNLIFLVSSMALYMNDWNQRISYSNTWTAEVSAWRFTSAFGFLVFINWLLWAHLNFYRKMCNSHTLCWFPQLACSLIHSYALWQLRNVTELKFHRILSLHAVDLKMFF